MLTPCIAFSRTEVNRTDWTKLSECSLHLAKTAADRSGRAIVRVAPFRSSVGGASRALRLYFVRSTNIDCKRDAALARTPGIATCDGILDRTIVIGKSREGNGMREEERRGDLTRASLGNGPTRLGNTLPHAKGSNFSIDENAFLAGNKRKF